MALNVALYAIRGDHVKVTLKALAIIASAAAMCMGASVCAAAASYLTIHSPVGLSKAIAEVNGPANLRLQPGNYGKLSIRGPRIPAKLVIESLDPSRPAVFTELEINGAENVVVRNLDVRGGSDFEAVPYLVHLNRVANVLVENLRITGLGGDERGRQYAIFVRGCDGVTVKGASIRNTRYGIGFLTSRLVSIEANELRDLQTDGIRGGGVDDLVITGNVIGNFAPKPGDHPDGIQLWGTNVRKSAQRIRIENNLIVRDNGGLVQGIFVADNTGRAPFVDIIVRGNLVIGSMYNGIVVSGFQNAWVINNTVLAFPDMKSWISVSNGDGLELVGNAAMIFNTKNVLNTRKSTENRRNTPQRVNLIGTIRAWLLSKPERGAPAGYYLRQLLGA